MSYLRVVPEHLQAAAPSFKSSVVGDINTGLTNVTNALIGTIGSISVVGPFASEIEEIITGLQGVLECLDNALNRTYIGLESGSISYSGMDYQLANTLNQINSTLSVFLGYIPPHPPPHIPNFFFWGGLILGEVTIDALTLGAATPEEVVLDSALAGGEIGVDALGAGAVGAAGTAGAGALSESLTAEDIQMLENLANQSPVPVG